MKKEPNYFQTKIMVRHNAFLFTFWANSSSIAFENVLENIEGKWFPFSWSKHFDNPEFKLFSNGVPIIIFMFISVVIQPYEAEADNEYVIRGNSAIMKCEIPSYVSDFIVVDMWTDSDGGSYYPNNDQYGIINNSTS